MQAPSHNFQPNPAYDAAALSGELSGEVSQWHEKGYGFILFADGRHAYVHKSQVDSPPFKKGDMVMGTVIEDAKNPGKWQAVCVKRTAVAGQLAAPNVFADTRTSAYVVEWTGKGYGFIQCSDGRRAYVHHSEAQGDLNVGQEVTAILMEDSKNPGKFQAVAVERKAKPVDLDQRAEGVVQEWNPKGYGFALFGDVCKAYIHRSSVEGEILPEAGSVVTAIIVKDSVNAGKFKATHVLIGPLGYDGVVSDWDSDKGWGFMQMDDGRRCYIHRTAFGDPAYSMNISAGTRLRCKVATDKVNPSKWCIEEVKAEVPRRETTAAPQEIAQAATVHEWSDRGYGFVMAKDGRRAYIHNSTTGGEFLTVGEELEVVLEQDAKTQGKWTCAQARRYGSCAPIGAVVTQWNGQQGYGFVQCDDARRAYLHRSAGILEAEVGTRLMVIVVDDVRNPGKFAVQQVVDGPDGNQSQEILEPVAKRARLETQAAVV